MLLWLETERRSESENFRFTLVALSDNDADDVIAAFVTVCIESKGRPGAGLLTGPGFEVPFVSHFHIYDRDDMLSTTAVSRNLRAASSR